MPWQIVLAGALVLVILIPATVSWVVIKLS